MRAGCQVVAGAWVTTLPQQLLPVYAGVVLEPSPLRTPVPHRPVTRSVATLKTLTDELVAPSGAGPRAGASIIAFVGAGQAPHRATSPRHCG